MRVVAGSARGRRLAAPRGSAVRPTADRVKEALFSSLAARLAGARVLDLYAGAGGLGIEAASRGAASVTFVERDRAALAALRTNLGVVPDTTTTIVAREVTAALQSPLPGAPFDLVLADPPYNLTSDALTAVLRALVDHLAEGATVVVERSVRGAAVAWPPGLQPRDPRRYGDTVLVRADWDPSDGKEPR